ncbi:MAG TPA: hypothetical protein VII01_00580 [Solirubrobacteraceae bacterium]
MSLTAIGVAMCAFVAGAAASPIVVIRGRAVPIPGFPNTGNILGAGAAVHAEVHISGTEYGGFPPPLIGVTTFLPRGVKLHPEGFPTCPFKVIMEEANPRKCPKGSQAGPVGKVNGIVAFGETRVQESAELTSYFAPGGGFEFFTDGHSPVSLEIPTRANLSNRNGGQGFGPKLTAQIPLISTVPGAPYASVESIDLTVGAARRQGRKVFYYGRVPNHCPKGGFAVRAELTFAENGDVSKPEIVPVNFKAPCPRK